MNEDENEEEEDVIVNSKNIVTMDDFMDLD